MANRLPTARPGTIALGLVMLVLLIGIGALYAVRSQGPASEVVTSPPASSAAPPTTPVATTSAPTSTLRPTATPLTIIGCGVLSPNSITTGQGSGPNTYELRDQSGAPAGLLFGLGLEPALGTYVCLRLIPGVPMNGFSSIVAPNEIGYVPLRFAGCGTVTMYASSVGLRILTIAADPIRTQFRLSGNGVAPQDVGLGSLILIGGRLMPPDSGSIDAFNLTDFAVSAVASCPPATVSPLPIGFSVPAGCRFVAAPVVGADGSEWRYDCGAVANHDARGVLAAALTAQRWTLCSSVTATATWGKGALRLLIAESSGAAGDYPRLTQPARPATTNCP